MIQNNLDPDVAQTSAELILRWQMERYSNWAQYPAVPMKYLAEMTETQTLHSLFGHSQWVAFPIFWRHAPRVVVTQWNDDSPQFYSKTDELGGI